MEKKNKLTDFAADAGRNAANLWEKTKDSVVKAVDQNEDGSFDMKDVAAIADSIGNSAKTVVANVKDNAENRSREAERKLLQPIFPEDLESPNFLMSKLIRVVEIDKKHAESEVCKGSIGYLSVLKDMNIVNIYRDKVNDFSLSFHPDVDYGVYYMDPIDRDHYISLDDYFQYIKYARLSELQKIAQDLGATHFRVSYREENAAFSDNAVKAKAKGKVVKSNASAEVNHTNTQTDKSSLKFAAENTFPGHSPVMPKLYYLKHDPLIQGLVAMRMDPTSPTEHQHLTLQLSNTSGIKEKDAVKIDAALKTLKVSADANVTSEARNEAHQYFEYEIEF